MIKPVNINRFLFYFRERLERASVYIPIIASADEKVIRTDSLKFNVNNIPLAIICFVIWGLIQFPGIWNIFQGERVSGIILLSVLNAIMLAIMFILFIFNRNIIILSEEGIITKKRYGGVDLEKEFIYYYNDIIEIRRIKHKIEISRKSGGLMHFNPLRKKRFYYELMKRVDEVRKRELANYNE